MFDALEDCRGVAIPGTKYCACEEFVEYKSSACTPLAFHNFMVIIE
jgi:hypothetical protein